MSAIIRPDDLYDQSEFDQSLKALQASHAGLSKSIISEVKRAAKEYLALKNQIKDLAATADKINLGGNAVKQLTGLNEEIEKNGKQLDKAKTKIKELNDAFKTNTDFVNGAKDAVDRLQKEIVRLSQSGENEKQTINRLNNELRQYQTAIKTVEAAQRSATGAIKEAQGSYTYLNKQTNELKKTLREMPGAFNLATGAINKQNKEAVSLQQQILKNTNALKNMDAQMGNHQRNVGNYASALLGVKNTLISVAAATIGVTTAFDAAVSSVKIIATMERQRMALRNASSSSAEYAKNLGLIERLATTTGAPLEATTDALRKFSGATQRTSIEGDKARRIFEAFSKTFTANGASADEFARATKALSDMMSKGTVQAEELKGQLGDAMPGALRIFAEAAGVSQKELLKMMQAGELLAEDILPKVAELQERTVGDKAQNNLKTMAGGYQQMTNEAQLFLASLNKTGIITRFFGKIMEGVGAVIKGFKEAGGWVDKVFSGGGKASDQDQFALFATMTPEQQERQLMVSRSQVREQKAKLDLLRQQAREIAKQGKEDSFGKKVLGLGGVFGGTTSELERLNRQIKTQADLANASVGALKKYIAINEEAKRKLAPNNTDQAAKTVQGARAFIDTIPDGLIGDNGKAQLTKDQGKQLRAYREDIIGLYNTLPKARQSELQIKSLLDTVNELLSGKKDPKAPKVKKELTDLEKQFKDIKKAIGTGLDEIAKNGEISPLAAANLRFYKKRLEELSPASKEATSLLKDLNKELNSINEKGRLVGPQIPELRTRGSDTSIREVATDIINSSTKKEDKDNKLKDKLKNDLDFLQHINDRTLSDQMRLNRRLFEGYSLLKDEEKEELKKHLAMVHAMELKGNKEQIADARRLYEEKVALMQMEARKRREILEQSLQLAGEVGAGIFEVAAQGRQNELDNLAKSKEHELSLVGDNKKAQERIEKDFDRKEASIKRKQAKADKENALFQIAVNTAINASRYTPANPLFYLALASGAVQAAIVLAKPIPQFFKGTNYSPEGPAMVAEYGPELIQGPKGDTRLIEKPSIVNLEKGSKVKTAFETRQMLKTMEDAEMMNLIRPGAMHKQALEIEANRREGEIKMMAAAFKQSAITPAMMREAFGQALDARPEKGMIYDHKGIRAYEKRRGQLTEYMNRKAGL